MTAIAHDTASGPGARAVRERVRITGIASGGAGVGRLADGRAVFVDRTAPGDVADIEVVSEHGRWARARLLSIAAPAPERTDPPCIHYANCGGCALQHLRYAAQLEAKASIVAAALHRIGGIADVHPCVESSPVQFGYRNRVSFTLRRTAGGVVAGFHRLDGPDRLEDIGAECLLPEPAIARVWGALRRAWGARAERLPGGPALRLTLRAGAAGEVMLLIEGGRGRGDPDTLLGEVPGLVSIWHADRPGGAARRIAGDEMLSDRWGGIELGIEGGAFVQVNRSAAELLEAHVAGIAGDVRGVRVIDAYCGIGIRARALAGRGAIVMAVDVNERAIELVRNAGPPNVAFIPGRVEEVLGPLLPVDLVILNPPRSGVHARVCETLRAAPPGRVLYVSCDPATLARDVARLRPVYALAGIHCFDLFPQTAHVETVAELSCATS
ncbi:MAG: TRAM domain-containing protein [Gemmatimonadetes bacterium]|nr:TRAM domain-containing protein [Gemmatimonadota bacterium]